MQLSVRKALVRMRIAGHRGQCVAAASELARPLAAVDGLWAKWRRISPLAKVVGTPLVLMVLRKVFKRLGHVAAIARAVPLIFQTARTVAGFRNS